MNFVKLRICQMISESQLHRARNGAKWCYVDPRNRRCPDLRSSRKYPGTDINWINSFTLTTLSWCNSNFSLRPRVEHPRLLHPRQDGPNLYRIWKIEKSRMHFDTSSLIVDNSILFFESFNIYLSQWYANHIWHLWINYHRLFYVTSFNNSYHYLTVCT